MTNREKAPLGGASTQESQSKEYDVTGEYYVISMPGGEEYHIPNRTGVQLKQIVDDEEVAVTIPTEERITQILERKKEIERILSKYPGVTYGLEYFIVEMPDGAKIRVPVQYKDNPISVTQNVEGTTEIRRNKEELSPETERELQEAVVRRDSLSQT